MSKVFCTLACHVPLPFRNCILTDMSVVKITDAAMGMVQFDADYVELNNDSSAAAPVRWQAWESIVLVSRFCQNMFFLFLDEMHMV
jgi:hypothetical protein